MTLRLLKGNLVEMDVDAIVNAANSQLARGGGVCGAIFEAAGGKELARACGLIGHCPTGGAVLTSGFRLKARHIIHTVGPVWRGGREGEPMELKSCYLSSLGLAADNRLKSIAFPLISAGIFGYPRPLALEEAIGAISEFFLLSLDAGEQEFLEVSIVFMGDVSDLAEPDLPKDLSKLASPSDEAGDSGEVPGERTRGMGYLLGGVAAERIAGSLPRLAMASNMKLARLIEISKERGDLARSEVLALSVGLGLDPARTRSALRALGDSQLGGQDWLVVAYYLAQGGVGINRINRNLFALGLPILP